MRTATTTISENMLHCPILDYFTLGHI